MTLSYIETAAAAVQARSRIRDHIYETPLIPARKAVVPAKLEKIKSYGVEVILHGAETGLAEQYAQKLAASGTYEYISPYNDPDIVAGQGTIGLEILEQCSNVDNIFISMGGGGLISGIGSVIKAFSPKTRIFGVSAINSKALAESMAAGHVVETEHFPTLAEAVAGGMDEDSITLPLAMAVIDQVIECSEDEIAEAMRTIAFEENMIVEGSAALALAGFNKVAKDLAGKTSIILLSTQTFDMEITIQSAKSEDIPAIVDFIKQARSVMFPWIDAESQNQHAQRELANFSRTYLDNPNGAFLTAYGNGQIIAAIGYAPYDDRFPELGLGREGVVEFVRLYVNPAWRRAGLASKLCAALEQRARDAGMTKLYLHTHPFLEGAIGFWERQGFSILQVDDDPVWQTTHMSKAL
ncbi:hypothetical protein K4K53_003568 [Colletotrichum sp. SAR 10_77]|nr:hypothetical protein K4K53_003568 [Colletotrichum sp. SAR 10_77]